MKLFRFKNISEKLLSIKAIILYTILAIILFLNWGSLINRFLHFESAKIEAYVHKEVLSIDSLKFNFEDIDTINLFIEKESFLSMEKTRSMVLNKYFKTGIHNIQKHNYHNAYAKYKSHAAIGKIKLFGMNTDHYHKNKLSYRIKFKGGNFFAKKKVNLLSPKTRSFQIDHIYNQTYNAIFKGIKIEQTPIILCVNNKSKGIYFMEDFFDKYLIEKNNKKESFIFESGFNEKFQGSHPISKLNTEDGYFNINTLPKGKNWENLSKRIINLFHNNHPSELFEIIDKKKLNAVIGLCFFAQDHHPLLDINLHWYYNSVNNKLEPLIRESYIHEIQTNYSIDSIWKKFYKKICTEPALELIEQWIVHQGEEKTKDIILQNTLKSALYIKQYVESNSYKNFISKLNSEFSYNTTKQEIILRNNISQILSKINLRKPQLIINDSLITINNDIRIDQDFIIENNMTLNINTGVNIVLSNNANIYIYGKANISGNSSNPVRFIGDENSNSAIYINSFKESQFNFCEFSKLSALNNNLKMPLYKDFWQTTSAITLYESQNISFKDCLFSDNRRGDDMINVVRSDSITFKKCEFKNILSDALDSDFSNLLVENCEFTVIGNDAIDVSGSNIDMIENYFDKILDKAISIGEKSHVDMLNCKIQNSELALVVKDGSLLQAQNITLENNRMDLIAFSKKEEYDSPSFKLTNCSITNYLIDRNTKNLGLENYYRTSQSIQDILYGVQYGKPSVK